MAVSVKERGGGARREFGLFGINGRTLVERNQGSRVAVSYAGAAASSSEPRDASVGYK